MSEMTEQPTTGPAAAMLAAVAADTEAALAAMRRMQPVVNAVLAEFNKNAVTFRVSREYLLDAGLMQPTTEEAVERKASLAASTARHAQKRASEFEAWRTLTARTDKLGVIARLHAPDGTESARWLGCTGCDYSGPDGDPGDWPCRTVTALWTEGGEG